MITSFLKKVLFLKWRHQMLIFVGLITSTKNVQKSFNVIFVISGGIASFWRVFIKFHWRGQKLTSGIDQWVWSINNEMELMGFEPGSARWEFKLLTTTHNSQLQLSKIFLSNFNNFQTFYVLKLCPSFARLSTM